MRRTFELWTTRGHEPYDYAPTGAYYVILGASLEEIKQRALLKLPSVFHQRRTSQYRARGILLNAADCQGDDEKWRPFME